MKKILFLLHMLLLMPLVYAQQNNSFALKDSLRSIASHTSSSAVFAALYYKATENIDAFAATRSAQEKNALIRFEKNFADYFFEAHTAHSNNRPIPSNWSAYYHNTSLNTVQYEFIGMNAHINGDMHLALVSTFSYDSLRFYRSLFLSLRSVMLPLFDSVYHQTFQYPKIRRLHLLTLGTDRWVGRNMIKHWRRRQINMALLWYKKPDRYKKRELRLQRKMKRWDRAAILRFK